MPESKHRTEFFVGLFVILGVGLLGWLIVHFGKFQGSHGGGYPITVEVKDATGIRAGVPVRLGGIDIGRVASDPELGNDAVFLTVELTIFPGRKIPVGSTVKVGTTGLMGDSFVRVIAPEKPSGAFFSEGHHILAESASSFNDLAGSAGETLEEVTITASEIRTATNQVESLFSKVENGILTDENIRNLSVILNELKASSEYIHLASKRLNPLLNETSGLLENVSETTEVARSSLAHFDTGVTAFSATLAETNKVLSDFDKILKDLNVTMNSANKLINELENGSGLAPSLLKDTELKRDLESFLDKLDRNGLLLYPREGGLLRDYSTTESAPTLGEQPEVEKRPFLGPRRQP